MRNFQRNILDRYPQDIQRRDYEFCSKDKVFVLNCEIISKIKKSGQEIVYDLINTGWRIGQYRLANWPIPVGDFANTGEGTFSKIWAGSRSKSKILKTWRVLELCLDMESSIKKKSIFLFPCPFKPGPFYSYQNIVFPYCEQFYFTVS